jgi:peptidoglycan DL-endopeptidase LytF
MNRRDMIIVTVLVNAGLLIVLFASAIKSSPYEEFVAAPPPAIQEPTEVAFKKEKGTSGKDEVDLALNQFSKQPVAPAQEPSQPVDMPASFAQDLRAITEPQLTAQPPAEKPFAQTLVAPVTPPAKTAPEFTEVKVKKGDVLEKIARQHHTTVTEVMKANKLTNSNLRIGQVLKIPNKTMNKAEVSSIAHVETDSGMKYYTVKKGDSPWTIAVKNHIKVEQLLKLNSLSEEQARRLKPGDQLRIQ